MDFNDIPLIQHLGLQLPNHGEAMSLPFSTTMTNHLGTLHAGAQFTLAETASGHYLMTLFPDLVDQVIPVLRSAQIKFKRPVTTQLSAQPFVSDEAIASFNAQLQRKGRGTIEVIVKLLDEHNELMAEGHYGWFVQSRD